MGGFGEDATLDGVIAAHEQGEQVNWPTGLEPIADSTRPCSPRSTPPPSGKRSREPAFDALGGE